MLLNKLFNLIKKKEKIEKDVEAQTEEEISEEAVNFAPDIEESLFDQIFNWVIVSGRKIIIFTELVVLAVFISRFWIDRQMHDIKENIENKQAIIESAIDIEKNHRVIQSKIATLQDVLKDQIDWKIWLDDFTKKIPETLILNELTLTKNTATLKAKTTMVQSFALFVNLLIADENVTSVVLTASKFDEEKQEYEFSMNIGLKR